MPSVMHAQFECSSLAGERKSMNLEIPLISTQPAWDRGRSGILPCTAASWYSQEFPLLLVCSCKEQKKYITLCWKGSPANCCYFEQHRPQKDSGNLEAWENLLFTHCWHSQCSLPSPITTYPPQIICFSQTFSHLKALLGYLRMFMTLLCHSPVMLPECLPNVWLLKKHGCL